MRYNGSRPSTPSPPFTASTLSKTEAPVPRQPQPPPAPCIPRDQWLPLLRRGLIVLAVACVIGVLNFSLAPTDAAQPRRLDIALVYALAISLLTWVFVDVGRYLWRVPPPSHWPARPLHRAVLLGAGIGGGFVLGIGIGDAYVGRSTWSLLRIDPNRFTGILLGSLAVSAVFIAFFYQRGRGELLARQAREAELRLLQSQLEPHMLFNTLANLRVLITLDPPRAQAMLDRLIAFLRSTLAASRAGTHTLAGEFARLDDYLGLMAVRMGPRLACTLTLPSDLTQHGVPALLLQPLVENAIRHGLEPKVEGGHIEVSAAREAGRLRLAVRDSGVGWPATPREGFGLAQVRERLATRFGATARLEIGPAADGGTLATLTLPLEPA
jgi:Histidine kinase